MPRAPPPFQIIGEHTKKEKQLYSPFPFPNMNTDMIPQLANYHKQFNRLVFDAGERSDCCNDRIVMVNDMDVCVCCRQPCAGES